jgi:hypothetical protein
MVLYGSLGGFPTFPSHIASSPQQHLRTLLTGTDGGVASNGAGMNLRVRTNGAPWWIPVDFSMFVA